MRGVYSKQQAEINGTFIYETPDGREVEISCLCSKGIKECSCKWPERKDLGEVTRFVRGGRRGSRERLVVRN